MFSKVVRSGAGIIKDIERLKALDDVPIDLSAGTEQEYVEDCPVCCRPNILHVEVDEEGDGRVWAEAE
ncbi:MAG TPA: CPXCG motif-containing cysteine-rich protein [Pirellulales bacterium]|nr:CPXCG motif-containing cysteine-rich protein [Pirellulales bacterium]